MSNNTNFEKESKDISVGSSFVEFLTVVIKFRKFLFWFILIITIAATTYALVAPKWYKSVSSVLPAERTDFLSSLSGLTSLAKNFSGSKGLSALTGSSESDKYIAILKSATVRDDVIKKFDLRKVYDLEDDYYEKVIKEFNSNVEIDIEDEGNLVVAVYDKDPQRAADIANYMIEKLNTINTNLGIINAKANREFVEKRYNQNIRDIDSLELEMKKFQQKYGIVSMPEQVEASIKAMTAIYSSLAEKEIQYNVLERTYSLDHPLVKSTKIEIEELNDKIRKINAGTDSSQEELKMIIPFKKAPELGSEYVKIYRSLEVQYQILEFVTPMYEQAKVEEVRNTPSVLVLDHAYAADRKAKPKGTIYALLSFVISLLVGLFLIFFKELFNRIKSDNPNKYNYLTGWVRSDFPRFFGKSKK